MTPDRIRAHLASITSTRTPQTAPMLDPVIRVLRAELARQTATTPTDRSLTTMTITHNPHHCPLCGLRWAAAPEAAATVPAPAAAVSLVKAYVPATRRQLIGA